MNRIKTDQARQTAYLALLRVERDRAYSNIILNQLLTQSMTEVQKRFASRLFYGVLERKLTLDYTLARLSEQPLMKLKTEVLVILRMGLYQLFYVDKVPASAAVNESVQLCKANQLYGAVGFVNGVLRAAARCKGVFLPDKRKGKNKYWSVKYSCPEEIIRLWRSEYGDSLTEGMLSSLEGRPPVCARVNTLKTNTEELILRLKSEGVQAKPSPLLSDCILMENTGAVESLSAYGQGLFHIQDIASQLCCRQLSAKPGDSVMDACSAPGGKAFTIAQLMENRGSILACDLYEQRLGLIREGARRLGIEIVQTTCVDSGKEHLMAEADRILCDVPCSGLGIIRRKPELRYKEQIGLDELPKIQYDILCSSGMHLKPGGVLVYSTCTLNPEENSGNIRRYLAEHPDFEPYPLTLPGAVQRGITEPENELTLFPQLNDTDGFFISAVRRK